MRKILLGLLIFVGFLMVFSTMSNSLDPDLGWNLRFGKEAAEGPFPYTDTYTWTHFGKLWVNHEWGGDILFWFIYQHFTYTALVLSMSLVVWGAFLLAAKLYSPRYSLLTVTVSLFGAWAVNHITIMRLASFSTLLFVCLVYTLIRPEKKLYWLWPPLVWLWAAIHGSWILAFITIAIWLGGQTLWHLLPTRRRAHLPRLWSKRDIGLAFAATVIAALVININPYGTLLWKEVIHYFSFSFYKAHISEWVPSYTYPIYWSTFAIFACAGSCLYVASRKKAVNYSEILLFIALACSAWLYKRQALFLVLASMPIIANALELAKNALMSTHPEWTPSVRDLRISYVWSMVLLVALALNFIVASDIHSDVWSNAALQKKVGVPSHAIQFLKQETGEQKVFIFNEFSWGAYLNWEMPNALVYLDGRGTATWQISEKETMLERYFKIMYEPNGIEQINNSPATYILLKQPHFIRAVRPNGINKLIFTADDFKTIFQTSTPQIIVDLTASKRWELVFSDAQALVWKRKANPAR